MARIVQSVLTGFALNVKNARIVSATMTSVIAAELAVHVPLSVYAVRVAKTVHLFAKVVVKSVLIARLPYYVLHVV